MARIRGTGVELLISTNNSPRQNITNIRSFEMTPELEILSEGYLGMTTELKDMIYNGLTGKFEMHFENQDILRFTSEMVDKATRRTPGVEVNLKVTLNFDNGQRPRIMIPGAEFGAIPMSFGGRKDYGNVAVNFAASGFKYLF
jgi:hypothetical protein